jgi:RNA polymerase sigma-70 factor (ECF subfamily)
VSDPAPSDFELLAAWREGDRTRGTALFQRHFASIYRFFRAKLGSHVDDLVQRTFLALVEGRDRIRGECSFRTYLFAVARKQLLMHLRTTARERRRISFETHSVVELGGAPPRLVAQHEQQALLLAAMQEIPVDYQIVIELFYWEDMAVAEIAGVLDVPTGTVKARLSRARELLRGRLAQRIGEAAGDPEAALDRWVRSLSQVLVPLPRAQHDPRTG